MEIWKTPSNWQMRSMTKSIPHPQQSRLLRQQPHPRHHAQWCPSPRAFKTPTRWQLSGSIDLDSKANNVSDSPMPKATDNKDRKISNHANRHNNNHASHKLPIEAPVQLTDLLNRRVLLTGNMGNRQIPVEHPLPVPGKTSWSHPPTPAPIDTPL